MGGENLSEQKIRSDSIWGDNPTFCLSKTIVQACELTLVCGATQQFHCTDSVEQMKKKSTIKLLFVNHKGIILT